ncbi:hypothetical protein [Flavobacterium sp.]|uniref:hypothetical protein n=1 Tax=Flavobacterium sp. TaxID=239 RepID=UPI0026297E70|nr:hypothetical protein [Flavobacterium sp.]
MKQLIIILFGLFLILQGCNGQTKTKKKEIFNKDFNWTITIPENFETVTPEQWMRLQNKGTDAIEKTYGEKIENNAKTIFVFRNDQFNYFESNYQPFDSLKDGSYDESFKEVNKMLYGTFEAQMPEAKLDSISSKETINGLTFNKFKTTIYFPNKMVMDFLIYSRLFDKREFTVNIMTVDKEKQKILLDAWKNSKFEK